MLHSLTIKEGEEICSRLQMVAAECELSCSYQIY
uniref:Uncharacterized protein n=1 Tax=Anguilla anguilla TaxID=7936 RepID=A0A0E9SGI7_ANGAN